ncbi:MAG: peptidase lon domain protein [Planctomycetaceae bacterium]|nr:peptidase lon domain protein [Planctomycetaceae bacterium]
MRSPFELTPDSGGGFSGIVRVFPLPNAVLFPHVLLPLHIFEPRYVEMVEDALDGDNLIALAQLKPGWETQRGDTPDLFPILCVGHIAHHVRLQNGHYNLVLQGTQRARLIHELPQQQAYRLAKVELLEEVFDASNETLANSLRAELLRGFRRLFPKLDVEHDLHHVFESDIPLGVLCDVFAYSLQLEPLVAQQLLAEADVERRSRLLLSLMEAELAKKPAEIVREFPPPFSLN